MKISWSHIEISTDNTRNYSAYTTTKEIEIQGIAENHTKERNIGMY